MRKQIYIFNMALTLKYQPNFGKYWLTNKF